MRLREHDWNYGFVIDGFPRNERQAEFFLESYDLDGVIHLDLPDREVARRGLARRLCANCGMDYSLIDNSPAIEGRCDACGGELIRREDDTEEVLAVRLAPSTTPRPIPSWTSSAGKEYVDHGGHPAAQGGGAAGHQGQARAAVPRHGGDEQPGGCAGGRARPPCRS